MLKKKFHPEHWQVMAAYLMIYDLIVIAATYFFALWIRFDCRISCNPERYLDIYLKRSSVHPVLYFRILGIIGL